MSDRRVAARSGLWSFVLQWARFGLNTVVFLILARWLSLAEIGAFAVAFAPINLLQLVQRTGFSETVVQGERDPGRMTDTLFWMSLGFGLVASLGMFGLSFVIGRFVESETTGTYLAAMSVIPALIGLGAVPEGILRQRQEIKTLAIRTTTSLSVAGLLAIWLGYAGYGGWALTAFAIVNALLSAVLVALLVNWRPGGGPYMAEARRTLPVLGAISGRGLAIHATMPLLQLMVGIGLGPAAAGAFQIAQRFLTLASTAMLTPLRFATLPIFVQVRDDPARLSRTIVKSAGLISLVSAPIYFGLLAVAPTLLPLVIGHDNGVASVTTLQAMLLVGGHAALFPVLQQSLTATGRANISLRWTGMLFVLNMTIGAITVLHSAMLTALGYSLLGYVVAPFAIRLIARYFDVPPGEFTRVLFTPVATSLAMVTCVMLFHHYAAGSMNVFILLACEIGLGAMVYAGLSLIVSRSEIATVQGLVSTLLPKRFRPRAHNL